MTSHLIECSDFDPSLALIAVSVFSEPVDEDVSLKIRDVDVKLCQLTECEPVIAAKPAVGVDLLGEISDHYRQGSSCRWSMTAAKHTTLRSRAASSLSVRYYFVILGWLL